MNYTAVPSVGMLPPATAATATATAAKDHAPVCSQASIGQGCCCCRRCEIGGCDIKVLPCGCCLHARCCPLSETQPLSTCPVCNEPATAVQLLPMPFDEIDQAQAEAAHTELSAKRGKKRQNATIARLQPSRLNSESDVAEAADSRTGRWTTQETAYCDKLILLFEKGQIPIPNGIKLNDFLAGMLKSKQARLTKKMKNAKLSTRQYRRAGGYIINLQEAKEFSQLETDFFASIRCNMERSEIKFHMLKEWRELFSNYCAAIGQPLQADSWLSSVEEMDRRASQQKDAARMTRRKIMMGYALSVDAVDTQHGVFIDPKHPSTLPAPASRHHRTASSSDNPNASAKRMRTPSPRSWNNNQYESPFITRVVHFIESRNMPFEHVDAWVPSLVPMDGMGAATPSGSSEGQCRLCFAGCATAETQVPPEGGPSQPMSSEQHFDLISFGSYSQKFSFDVGCGLPGRVYNNGTASWERGIANAPKSQFERAGGAKQWGIQTVLGVPVASPNVGRIVVLFYSRFDRERDDALVTRIMEELTKLTPSPQWKLVVEVGIPKEKDSNSQEALQERELHTLIKAHMPSDKNSPLSEFLPGFASLCLLLAEQARSDRECLLLESALESYRSHKSAGRRDVDVAWMTARDFMNVSKSHVPQVAVPAAAAATAAAPGNSASTARKPGASCRPGGIQAGTAAVQSQNGGVIPPSQNLLPTNAGEKNSSAPGLTLGGIDSGLQNQGHDFSSPVVSPALQPITNGNQADLVTNLGPLGLTASQLSALLQADASTYFHGNGTQ